MRIGEFSNINNVSIDAVRHYMDLGLVIPEKVGGHYFFDEKCTDNLNSILDLKNMGFTLTEIKTIFMFKSLGKLTNYEEDLYYKNLFLNKHKSIEIQIDELLNIKDRLTKKIDLLNNKNEESEALLGVNLNFLSILRCSKCQNQLTITEANIRDNHIIDGKLHCSCKKEYLIESGILKVSELKKEYENNFNMNYISNYITLTDISYLDTMKKNLELSSRKISSFNLNNKVLLELGSGVGFFLRNIYEDLPDDCLYIAVDHDIDRHKFLKSVLERGNQKKNILFICCDFLDIPIKNNSIDMLLDISGTSNYSFDHEDFLLSRIDNYLKEDSTLLGSYIVFKNFKNESLIEKKYRNNFLLDNIKNKLNECKYNMIEDITSGYIDKGGKYENFFVHGEKIYSYVFYGKR